MRALLLLTLIPQLAIAEERPVIAVFELEDRGAKLAPATRQTLSDLLATLCVRSAAFQVVPSAQLKDRLQGAKQDSYASCYDEACQIEIGKELAATKTLASRVMKLGKKCVVTSTLLDLKKATAERAATRTVECSDEALAGALEAIVGELGGAGSAPRDPLDPTDASNWITKDGTWRIERGEIFGSGGTFVLREELSDLAFEAEIERVAGPTSVVALVWRRPIAMDQGYSVNLLFSGAYNVFNGLGGAWRSIATGPLAGREPRAGRPPPVVPPGWRALPLLEPERNRLRVEVKGPSVKVWVNGALVEDLTDRTHAKGFVGLWVEQPQSMYVFRGIKLERR